MCGRRRDPQEDERYRIPPALRDNPDRQREQSWSAQTMEAEERARFGDQTVGPFGYRQRAAEMNYEWRRERAERERRRAEEQRLIDAGPR